MRDIVFSLAVLALMPICYRRPFVGLLTFSWLGYMRPQDLTWGFARGQRWSFFIALIMFAGWVAHARGKLFPNDVRCWAMVALIVLVGLGLASAGNVTKFHVNRYIEYIKIVTIALFTTGVVLNKNHLRLLVWVVALSFGFYGVKNGMAGVLSGGSLVIRQGPGGMLEDNNDFSLALCMALPLLVHIGTSEKREVFRQAMKLIVPLTALTVILTYSRGGFLSLCTVIGVLVWRSRNRVAGLTLLFVLGVVGIIVAPAEYKDRLTTIVNYEQDGSAMGRLRAWKVAIRMATANPVLGVGFNKFQENYLQYCDIGSRENVRVAHNSYLQIWAECGTPAFALYLFLIAVSLLDLWKVRRMARERYRTSWIISYATMFETSLAAFVIGSIFLNRAHFDLFYHFVAIVLVFGRIARAEMASPVAYPVGQAGRGRLQVRRARGFGHRPALDGFGQGTLAGRS